VSAALATRAGAFALQIGHDALGVRRYADKALLLQDFFV
jgi:hypothetical protein